MTTHPPHTPRPAGAPLPLAGIRVADFSHFIAGPICAMILADMGADVIKIEKSDGGDDFRRIQPPITEDYGAPFLWGNRNKRSIALDLKQTAAQQVARDIVAQADILIENFSTGVMDRFDLGYDAMAALNPRLIYCTISAYGRTGALSDRIGFDPITQAESGFMSMNGEPDRPGMRTSPSIMDMSTAMMTTNAVLGALFARERTGKGQLVESALFDQAVTMVGFHSMMHLAGGREVTRFGNNSTDTVPTTSFETADKPIFVCCANDRTWHRMAGVIGHPELAENPDYARTPQRTKNRDALLGIIRPILKTQNRAYWLEKMRAAGVPAGAINTVTEAFASSEMAAREMVTTIPHPTAGSVPNIRLPFRLHGTPLADPVPAPTLSQHAEEIMRGVLGYPDDRIAALTAAGAVLAARR